MALTNEFEILASLQKSKVPDHLHHGIAAWITKGQQPGHFLSAVIKGDLFEAIHRADDESLTTLPVIVRWLYNHAPGDCCGSANSLDYWSKLKAAKTPN